MTALRLKSALSSAVYQKSMRLSREALQRLGSGFIINLISSDIFKISSLWMMIHVLWWQPALIVGVLLMLYHLLGPAAIAGVFAMVFVLTCGVLSTHFQSRLRRETVKLNDQRVGLTGEILTNIRGVKAASKESELMQRVSDLRDAEVSRNKKITLLSNITTLASTSSPVLAMGAIFVPLVSSGAALDPAQIFPTLALLMTLRFSLSILPDTFLLLMESQIACRRLRNFFLEPEFSARLSAPSAPGTVLIENARYEWASDKTAISIPLLAIEPGELVAVIGEVGSGKSALLLGLLDELRLAEGVAHIAGAAAYVAQQPWLMSDTVRNNIVCNQPFSQERYQRALNLSQLDADLRTFPGGDQVEIGERGITLSGGQRQRLALARAYYQEAQIVLLDDPLSALDPAVAEKVFDQLIRGAWRGTTRILVTHRLEYALRADRVLVIADRRLVFDGRPEEAMAMHASKDLFAAHNGAQGVAAAESSDGGESNHNDGVIQKAITREDRESGSVNRKVVFDYLRLFVPGVLAGLLILLFVIRQFFSAGLDLWWTFSSAHPSRSGAQFITGFILLAAVVCALNFLRSFFVLRRGLIAGRDAHRRLLSGVLRAPLRFFESNPTGRILNRFSRDLETVDTFLPRSVFDFLVCCFDVITTVCVVVVLQPLSLLVVVPVLSLYFKSQRIFRPTSREVQRLDSVTRSPIFAILSESLRGLETLRAFKVLPSFEQRFDGALDTNGNAYFSLVAANRWLGVRLELLGALITLTAALSACFVQGGALGAALGGFALTYSMSITSSMNWFVRQFAQTENNLTSFERIENYAQQSPERWDGEVPPPAWPERGEIIFENASLRYRPELPLVLKEVSFSVKGGQRIGVIGRTGSGKSTLTQAIFRLLELDSGRIVIDGRDISSIALADLRARLVMIPQEPALFSGTIRSNLDPRSLYSDQALYDALSRVELAQFVRELPQQLAAPVIEGGHNLSVGQRQLLCLAQALLNKRRIMVLDEATANVDPKSDRAIQNTIRREFPQTTQIIIAHRLGTVMDCNLIVMLENGRVVKVGTPHELLVQAHDQVAQALKE